MGRKHEHGRAETDEKLRAERAHTDEELLERSTALGEDADHVIERARARARAVLELARRREDQQLERRDASGEERGSLARERRASGQALESEQVEADATRLDERSRRVQALLQLLAAERDETDRTLASERWMSDRVAAAHDDAMAGISHDLRGHLGVLLLGTSTIISEIGDNREIVKIADRMQRSIGHMNQLVTDLLDVASMAAEALQIRPGPTDLVELVRGAREIVAPTAEARRIQVRVQLPSAPFIVQADSARITRALVNVLSNALKFTPPKGRVTVTLVDVGDDAEVSIADTGPGIPKEKLDTVFERFERVDPNARGSGHGLGLYITRAIVNAHGGRIWAESTLREGSTFHIRLPRTQKLTALIEASA